jgi:transposase
MAKLGKIIGTDISKSSFSVAYRKGESVETQKWDYTQEQMEAFAETLDKGCTVVMEATGVYHTRLAYYLYDKGISVSVVNPLASKNFARTLMRRTKTDKADSKLLMEYGETMELEPWVPRETWCVEVQQIYALLVSKGKELTAARNRMEALSHSVVASGMCINMVKADIKRLEGDIAFLEKEIEHLVKANAGDDMKRIEAIPGIGRRTACVLIALTGSMKRFDNYRQVASYLGLCPRVYESGTSIRGKTKICKMGLESVRRMLYLCALSAKKYNKTCRELYERLLEKGKAKKLALVAVANKLIKQAFAILKSGMNYDENHISEKKVQKMLAY